MKDSSATDGSVQHPCWDWGSSCPTSSPATPNPGLVGAWGTHLLGIPGGFIPTSSPRAESWR